MVLIFDRIYTIAQILVSLTQDSETLYMRPQAIFNSQHLAGLPYPFNLSQSHQLVNSASISIAGDTRHSPRSRSL